MSELLHWSFPLLLVVAAVWDVWRLEIPDWISYALLAGAGLLIVLHGIEPAEIAWRAGLAVAMLVAGIVLFAFRVWGGGDVKLAAAITLWTGTAQTAPFILLFALAGGALALLVLVLRRLPRLPGRVFDHLQDRNAGVPYGVALAAGGVLLWLRGPLIGA